MILTLHIAFLILSQIDASQSSPNFSHISMPIIGRVTSTNPLELGLLRVQVRDVVNQRVVYSAPLNMSGNFSVPSLPASFYELRILGQADELLYTEDFHAGNVSSFNISLKSPVRRTPDATVSAQRLLHKTPKKAAKEMDAAAKALDNKQRPKAIEHLEKALAEDPDNFDILANLGALNMQEHNFDKSVSYLERAALIDPADSVNNVNLSAYYAQIGNFQKAEALATAGLKTNPNSVRGRYMLAVSLVQQNKQLDTAKSYLNQIQKSFAPARNLLNAMTPID